MKMLRLLLAVLIISMGCAVPVVQAQWDDLYYNPKTDEQIVYGAMDQPVDKSVQTDDEQRYDEEETYYAQQGYDEDEDEYYYEYYYSSRIRRFHRPYFGFGYFDACYTNGWFYDPFYQPGVSIYVYNDYDYWAWRRWRRWNRWNSPWGCYNGGWYSNNFIFNNYYYSGAWYGYSYYDPYWSTGWYGNYYGGNWWYNDNSSMGGNTHYGPRRTGAIKTPRNPNGKFTGGPDSEPPVDATTPRIAPTRETLQPGSTDWRTTTVRKENADQELAPATTRQGTPTDDAPPARPDRQVKASTDAQPGLAPATRRRVKDRQVEQRRRARRTAPDPVPPRTRRASPPSSSPNRTRYQDRASKGGNYNTPSRSYRTPSRSSRPTFSSPRNSSPSRSSSGQMRSSSSSNRSTSGSSRSHSPRRRGN